ncbi:phosphoglycerate mutase-like protein at74 [Quercus suber]|uniref:Phosphoglycerate mutase-like protein at74 n=1 Tax=Quercus suber TaxID=58331 RepID=A0AAW0J467_QUESU
MVDKKYYKMLIKQKRLAGFLESLWRDIDMNRLHHDPSHDLTLIIVSHGLTSQVFLMKWFKWTVEQFERLKKKKKKCIQNQTWQTIQHCQCSQSA